MPNDARPMLQVTDLHVSYGAIKAIDAVPMYALGMAALRADPNLMLCDSPECLFCRDSQKKP